MKQVSECFAIIGGVLLFLLVCITAFSVGSRALFNAPIPGDVELVEMGCAIAVFYFLPLAHVKQGHFIVPFPDRFILKVLPGDSIKPLLLLKEFLFLLLSLLFLFYLPLNGFQLLENREETIVLGLPLWLAYLAIFPALLALAFSCVYSLYFCWHKK